MRKWTISYGHTFEGPALEWNEKVEVVEANKYDVVDSNEISNFKKLESDLSISKKRLKLAKEQLIYFRDHCIQSNFAGFFKDEVKWLDTLIKQL